MHGYFITRRALKKRFSDFIGGQFFIMRSNVHIQDLRRFMEIESDQSLRAVLKELGIEEGESLSYRGEIKGLEMSPARRELTIRFNWLCLLGKGSDGFGGSKPKWIPVHKIHGCNQSITIVFTGGYFPKSGSRIKVWTTLNMITSSGEYCRLYKPGDPDNLVWTGEGLEWRQQSPQRQQLPAT